MFGAAGGTGALVSSIAAAARGVGCKLQESGEGGCFCCGQRDEEMPFQEAPCWVLRHFGSLIECSCPSLLELERATAASGQKAPSCTSELFLTEVEGSREAQGKAELGGGCYISSQIRHNRAKKHCVMQGPCVDFVRSV